MRCFLVWFHHSHVTDNIISFIGALDSSFLAGLTSRNDSGQVSESVGECWVNVEVGEGSRVWCGHSVWKGSRMENRKERRDIDV